MLSVIGGFVLKLFSGPILSFLEKREVTKRDTTLAGIASEKDQNLATLSAAVEANKLKAASQAAYPWIVYLIAVPPALHSAGIFLDSLPFWTPWGAHVVGAWGVPKPPPPYDDWQGKILLSFFVVAPVVQAVRAGAAALSQR